jgi:hypothetical protein
MSSPSPSQHLLPVLFRSLETALADEYARRYDEDVALHRDEGPPDSPARLRFRIEDQGFSELTGTLAVTPADNGTYEVCCAVDRGRSRRFSYTVPPEAAFPPATTPRLGRALAAFLLNALQEELSRLVLEADDGAFVDVV